MNRLLITTGIVPSAVIRAWSTESDDKTETKFIEPIITEETMPNEPKREIRCQQNCQQPAVKKLA
jgi:hypothetical protein